MATPSDKKKFVKQCEEFDYIRFTFTDMNGLARGKLVPRKSVAKFLEDGIQIYAGTFLFGADHQIAMKTMEEDVVSKGNPSCYAIPDPDTLHPVAWSGDDDKGTRKWQVGQLLCQTYWLGSKNPQPGPRAVARKMLKILEGMGWELLSGNEFEFKVYKDTDPTRRVPVFPACEYASTLRTSLLEDLIFYLESNINAAGINLENLQCEYSPGQFEFVSEPLKGIKGADNAFVIKQGITEMLLKKGYGVSFMAKADFVLSGCSGAHFNFSLWDKLTGENVFYDASASDKLTSAAKHFIAGLVKHAPAVTALCSPTFNCYRRVHQPWSPDVADWNYGDRNAFLRIKNEGENGTYMENRVPSAAANPYIVLAATLAAGIDGVIKKMTPPEPHNQAALKLPSTLSEALDALEADKELIEILGKDFVKYFIGIKRELELPLFENHDVSKSIPEQLAAEIAHYEITP